MLDNTVDFAPLPNYSQFRQEFYEPLTELWDASAELSENFMNIAKETVVLPFAEIQLPILTAYALIPSAIASVVPILVLQGDRGSGKTTLTDLISILHGTNILSAATTFAAIRNHLNKIRWEIPSKCELEKNCCLLFDNVGRDTLNDSNLYTMLLNGYNRKTDTISISKGNGENIEFKVFSLKVMSSVFPFYVQSKYSELARRCIVVKCKPYERMSSKEKQSLNLPDNFNINNRLELESIDLSILNTGFKNLWQQEDNLLKYMSIKRKLTARKKSFQIPDIIDGAKWTISIDLIAAGIVTGVWPDLNHALLALEKYWNWYSHNITSSFGATHQILKDFINDETTSASTINAELGYQAAPMEINPEKLKRHISWASNNGMLDIAPNPATIAEIMADLGWSLGKGGMGRICWMPSTK